ncbi:MAG: hypothetical protein GY822_24490 [Deltaproteobacteria bacterium]|nr:hypothetical protein [Deltaproteobacteria bacterium]
MKHVVSVFSSLMLALSFACSPETTEGPDDGGVSILDSGVTADDAGGNTTNDAGGNTTNDAGNTTQPDSGIPDFGDAGFTLPFDGGDLEEYTGTAEEGVRCGDSLDPCTVGASCCLAFSGLSLSAQCGEIGEADGGVAADAGATTGPVFGQCADGDFEISCDDTADCGGAADMVCCAGVVLGIPPLIQTSCLPKTECAALDLNDDNVPDSAEVCTDTNECENGLICCGAAIGSLSIPADFGFCRDSCDIGL